MIRAEVSRGKRLPFALRQAIPALTSALDREVLALGLKLSARVKQKLSGEVLKVQTGRLRRSIHLEMQRTSHSTTAVVGTMADADAAVSRLLDGPDATGAAPDLRLVTRGARAGPDVVDEVASTRPVVMMVLDEFPTATLLDADGAAVVVHADPDDEMTDPTGKSGKRILCGVLRAR